MLRPPLSRPTGSSPEAHKTSMKDFRGLQCFTQPGRCARFAGGQASWFFLQTADKTPTCGVLVALPEEVSWHLTCWVLPGAQKNCGRCCSFATVALLLCCRSYRPPSVPAIMECSRLCFADACMYRLTCSP